MRRATQILRLEQDRLGILIGHPDADVGRVLRDRAEVGHGEGHRVGNLPVRGQVSPESRVGAYRLGQLHHGLVPDHHEGAPAIAGLLVVEGGRLEHLLVERPGPLEVGHHRRDMRAAIDGQRVLFAPERTGPVRAQVGISPAVVRERLELELPKGVLRVGEQGQRDVAPAGQARRVGIDHPAAPVRHPLAQRHQILGRVDEPRHRMPMLPVAGTELGQRGVPVCLRRLGSMSSRTKSGPMSASEAHRLSNSDHPFGWKTSGASSAA